MDIENIAKKIIELKNADFILRARLIQNAQHSEGYNEEMEALHNDNAKMLNEIIDRIGYPTSDKVGKEASEAAWLVIQHSIAQPSFMKKCVKLLEKEVEQHKADPIDLAYLSDRIAVFEGKPQLYGTQFDWDENGELSPDPFDNLTKVNDRRRSVRLNTLDEQTQIMREQVKNENQTPPKDFEKRKQKYDQWRKIVGWL